MVEYSRRVFVYFKDTNCKSISFASEWSLAQLIKHVSSIFQENINELKMKKNLCTIVSTSDIYENDELIASYCCNSKMSLEDLPTCFFKTRAIQRLIESDTSRKLIEGILMKGSHLVKNADEMWFESETDIMDQDNVCSDDRWSSYLKTKELNINNDTKRYTVPTGYNSLKLDEKKTKFNFDEPDSDINIHYEIRTGKLLECSVEKVIQKITSDQFPDTNFVKSFLLTYILYMSPQYLLKLLKSRWKSTFKSNIQNPKAVRLRVYNVLKIWIDKHGDDIKFSLLDGLTSHMEKDGFINIKEELSRIKQKHDSRDSSLNDSGYSTLVVLGSINDYHPRQIAQEISWMQKEKFDKIHQREFIHYSLGKTDHAPNLVAFSDFSKFISNWVCSEILDMEDELSRAVALNRFIHCAQYCIDLGNYQGAHDIYASIHRTPVLGLKSSWNMLPPTTWKVISGLPSIIGSNGSNTHYRALTSEIFVPIIYVILYDLCQAHDHQANLVSGTSQMINISKMSLISSILSQVASCQIKEFKFERNENLHYHISTYTPLDEKTMFTLTSQYERDRTPEDQRITLDHCFRDETLYMKFYFYLESINLENDLNFLKQSYDYKSQFETVDINESLDLALQIYSDFLNSSSRRKISLSGSYRAYLCPADQIQKNPKAMLRETLFDALIDKVRTKIQNYFVQFRLSVK